MIKGAARWGILLSFIDIASLLFLPDFDTHPSRYTHPIKHFFHRCPIHSGHGFLQGKGEFQEVRSTQPVGLSTKPQSLSENSQTPVRRAIECSP